MQGVGDDVLDALVVLGGVPLERPPDVGGEAAVKTAPAPPPRPGPPAPGWRRCGRPRLRGAGGRREQVRHEASRGLLEQSGGDVVVDGGDVARLGGAVPAEWHSELVDHLLVAQSGSGSGTPYRMPSTANRCEFVHPMAI